MKNSLKIVYYRKPDGAEPVFEFLKALPVKDRLKMERCIELLKVFGLNLQMPHTRSIVNHQGLFELRSQTGGNIQRIFYFTVRETEAGQLEAVLLHGFTKKTEKTPSKEIALAEQYKANHLEQKEQHHGEA